MSPLMSASTVDATAVFSFEGAVDRFVTRNSRSPACRPLTKLRTLALGPLTFKMAACQRPRLHFQSERQSLFRQTSAAGWGCRLR